MYFGGVSVHIPEIVVFELSLQDGKIVVAGENAGYHRPLPAGGTGPYHFTGGALFTIEEDVPLRQLMQDTLCRLAVMGYRIINVLPNGNLFNTYFVIAEDSRRPGPVGEAMSDD
jgi:hypothetical protein